MAGKYASKTSVPVDRTRNEIESTLTKYGAAQFGFVNDTASGSSAIEFVARNRRMRFVLPMPERKSATNETAWCQLQRQRWRALLLAIKAKLEAVECGISTFESEFLANIVDPLTNRTVGDVMLPQIAESYEGRPAQLLLTTKQPPTRGDHARHDDQRR